jgi:hypothetical protein
MKYPDMDPRASDLVGRITYLKTVTDDADQISRVLQKFAAENLRTNPALSGYLHRLFVVTREFVDAMRLNMQNMPQSLREHAPASTHQRIRLATGNDRLRCIR